MDRREAIKWMLAAVAAAALLDRDTHAADPSASGTGPIPGGYGLDPDLLKEYQPGDLWPLTLDPDQRSAAAALCDAIIPPDDNSPAASAVGVVEFIDEWISAPYSSHQVDRALIVDGLAWLDAESQRRFGRSFAKIETNRQNALCDYICFAPAAKPGFERPARFFARYRDLTAGGYYTTSAGMKAIGYVGNVPLATFDGPSPDVLRQMGLV